MKQALLRRTGDLEVMETPPPELPPRGVVVAMQAAAICRADIKMFRKGQKDLVLPRIPGHEGVGEIVQSDDARFAAGTRVALYPGVFCGKCSACRTGQTSRCRDLRICGFNEDGFFRTLVPFPEDKLHALVPVPRDIDPSRIVMAEPLACCINALSKFRYLQRGAALVIGAGAVGSLFAALLKSQGFCNVVIADRDPGRLAQELPPRVIPLNVSGRPLHECLKDLGMAGHVDFMVAACAGGLAWPFWEAMKPGGCVSFFSGHDPDDALKVIDLNILHYRELTLAGAYGCNLPDFQSAVELLIAGSVDISFLEPRRLPLREIMAGIEMLERHKTKKVIITEFQEA
ncbi:MAG: alcohol dehydrogenase catalytic domain-containing protein [Syntrophales bacterium]|nr:alcohol dehydrogenase catalytic domain-containing protein [Syntrophales bacterium]